MIPFIIFLVDADQLHSFESVFGCPDGVASRAKELADVNQLLISLKLYLHRLVSTKRIHPDLARIIGKLYSSDGEMRRLLSHMDSKTIVYDLARRNGLRIWYPKKVRRYLNTRNVFLVRSGSGSSIECLRWMDKVTGEALWLDGEYLLSRIGPKFEPLHMWVEMVQTQLVSSIHHFLDLGVLMVFDPTVFGLFDHLISYDGAIVVECERMWYDTSVDVDDKHAMENSALLLIEPVDILHFHYFGEFIIDMLKLSESLGVVSL